MRENLSWEWMEWYCSERDYRLGPEVRDELIPVISGDITRTADTIMSFEALVGEIY